MAELPGWVGKITDLATKIARLTGNVESLKDQVALLSEKNAKSEEKIMRLEADLRVAKAELKGEAQVAAVNAVIQAHEQMIERLQKVEQAVVQSPPHPKFDGKNNHLISNADEL